METQQTKKITERINFFAQKAGENEKAYQDFLILVAQPLLFSTDFLYKLWLNFKGYKQKDPKKQPSYLVVSDFILSSLCQSIGTDLFRMEDEIREHLLSKTTKEIRKDVALFIEEYAIRNKSNLSKNVFEIHSLFAKGVLHPSEMEKEIIEKLKSDSNPNEKANYLNLYFNSLPFGENGTQKAGISLAYANNLNEENVFRLGYLPKGVEESIEKNNKEQQQESNIKEKKPEQVLWLEQHLGVELGERKNCKDLFNWSGRNYVVNDNNEVIGFQLNDYCISDISFISKFPELICLDFSWNEGVDIALLSDLKKIEHLRFTENEIYDISPLSNLSSLVSLDIFGNHVKDISPLTSLLSLRILNLSHNQISDVSFLAQLTNLTTLHLSSNQISNISPLLELPNLKELYLKGNPIENIPKEIYDIDGNCLEGVRAYFENSSAKLTINFPDQSQEEFTVFEKLTNHKFQAVIRHIENKDFAAYFDEMNGIEMSFQQFQTFNDLRGIYIAGKASNNFNFRNRLETFTNELNGEKNQDLNKKPLKHPLYVREEEIQELKKAIETLLNKQTTILKELSKTSNAAMKFALTKQLDEIINEQLKDYRQKLKKLEDIDIKKMKSENNFCSSQEFAVMFDNAKKESYFFFIKDIEENKEKLSNHEKKLFSQLRNKFVHQDRKFNTRTWKKEFLSFIQSLDIQIEVYFVTPEILDNFEDLIGEKILNQGESNSSTSNITENYLSKEKITTQLLKRKEYLEKIRNKKTKYKIDNVRKKRTRTDIEVVLEDITQANTLEEIAYEIRKKQEYSNKTLFIGFWIKYQMKGTGYWARATFEPTLSLKIQGMQIDEELQIGKILLEKYNNNSNYLGIWTDVWGKNYRSIRFEDGRYLQTHYYADSVYKSILHKEDDIFTWDNSNNEQAIIQNDKLEFYAENGNRLFDSFVSIFDLPI